MSSGQLGQSVGADTSHEEQELRRSNEEEQLDQHRVLSENIAL